MIGAFNHEFATGFLGTTPMGTPFAQVLIVTATIASGDPRYPQLVEEVNKFKQELEIGHVVMFPAN